MLCVCDRKCQTRNDDGKILFYTPGQVVEFKECPTHFTPVGRVEQTLDFATASEEVLLAANFDLKKLRAFIKETYDVSVGALPKVSIIASLLDARERFVDKSTPKDAE